MAQAVGLRAPRSMEVEYPIGLESVMADAMSLNRSSNRILCWGEIAGSKRHLELNLCKQDEMLGKEGIWIVQANSPLKDLGKTAPTEHKRCGGWMIWQSEVTVVYLVKCLA